MTVKEKKARAAYVLETLEKIYPSAECALEYGGDPWRLLVMGRLSAQCTDARVNIVCRDLFAAFPTMEKMAAAPTEEIEKLIYSCGFYHTKAQNLRDFSAILLEKFNGRVPDTMEDLLSLPGVGRKIANLILGDIYHKSAAVVADTHCIRISNRLGLAESREPEKVEYALRSVLDPEKSADFCHRLVWFGRDTCDARKPKCEMCPFRELHCKL